jgi:hypothetical protein
VRVGLNPFSRRTSMVKGLPGRDSMPDRTLGPARSKKTFWWEIFRSETRRKVCLRHIHFSNNFQRYRHGLRTLPLIGYKARQYSAAIKAPSKRNFPGWRRRCMDHWVRYVLGYSPSSAN